MTIRIQGCVRTASSNKNGEDNIVYGRLTLSAGAWDFGYNVTYGEVSVTWVPSTARISLSPDTTSIVFRLWNTSSEVLRQNPDTKALGVQPVLQEEVNLEKFGDDGYKHKLSLELNEFLVFGFEGTGPALGEQEKKSDDGSTEQLSVVRTQLEKAKQQSEANIVSLQEAFNAEKRAMQKAFDAEKTKLQDGFKAQKAELQHKTQEKTKDLEQRLGKTTKEIREANTTKARAEKQCATMKDTENALREQITQVSQERDEIKTKLQELNDQAAASNQADAKQTDAKQTDEKQANSISALESKNTDDSAKSADLLQTVTSENKGLKGNVPLLQGAADIVGKVLEYGKTNAVEPKARLTPLESHNWKLSQDLQKARNDLTRSESTRSRLEEDNNRATARLAGLETEAGERQEQIQQLTQDLQAQKASHEAALSELERFKKLVAKESSDAEKPAGNPNPELPGLEKRIESTTTEKNDRNIANPELFKERVRQRPANNNGRLRAEADRLKGRVDAAEKQSSVLKADLLTTRNKLERCQATLKDERARYAKLLYSLKCERAKSAEIKGNNAKLANNLEAARAEAKGFSDSYNSAKAELEKTKQELTAEVARLTDGLQSVRTEAKEFTDSYDSTKEKLEATKQELAAEVARLTDNLEAARTDAKNFSESYNSTKAELEKTKQELAAEVVRLTDGLEDVRAEAKGFSDSYDSTKAKLENTKRELAAEVAKLTDNLESARAEAQSFSDSYDSTKAELEEAKRTDDLENARAEAKRFSDSYDSTRVELEETKKELAAEIARLTNDLEGARANAKRASNSYDRTKGELEKSKRELKTEIGRLTDGLQNVRAQAEGFSDLYNSIKAELEKTKQALAAESLQSEKQARQIKIEAQRTKELEAKLEKAFQSWLEYDKKRPDAQLGNELGAYERYNEALETAKAEHAADVDRLENEVQRMEEEIRSRDSSIRQLNDSIASLDRKLRQELDGEIKSRDDRIRQLNDSAINLERKLRKELDKEIKSRDDKIRQLKDSIANLERRFQQDLDAEIESRDDRIRQLNDSNTKLERRLRQELNGEIKSRDDKIRKHNDSIANLERELRQELDAEIKNRDDRIRQLTDSTVNLERRLQHELDLKAAIELKVHDLETQAARLIDSLAEKDNDRAQLENRFNLEVSSHASTQQALTNMTQRATNNGNQLSRANTQLSQQRNKLEEAGSAIEYEQSRVRWATSELEDKRNELQQAKITVSNQKAKIRTLEGNTKHNNCVTKESVDKVIGSYERLHDFAKRKGSRKKTLTLHKAHYPDGLAWADGKYFVKFRDEWF